MHSTMMNFPLTLNHIVERAGLYNRQGEIASQMPDKSMHRYTYADFYDRSRKLAEMLVQLGLKKGDRVGTLMWNHYAHLEAYFAAPIAGGVTHTLNLRLHPTEIAYLANHAEDRFIIVDEPLLPLFMQFKDLVKAEQVIVVSFSGKAAPEGMLDYEELLSQASGNFEYPEIDENDPAGMCYTSGTTGRPKGVVYSHRAIVLHTLVLGMAGWAPGHAISQKDVVLPVVPMFHANAWGMPYICTLVGAKQVLPGPFLDPVSLLDLYDREKVTYTAGVPTIWLGMIQVLENEPERWNLAKGMRMVVGGSAAPESMIRRFEAFDLDVIHAWGMTETTPLGSLCEIKQYLSDLSPDERFALKAKQGLPAPFVEARVVNDQGVAAWDGKTPGELQVRGAWVASSYYRAEGEENKWTEDGWFRTGDVANIDPEGYIKITDRTKDLIKSGGEWISSLDLENALMGHPRVKEAAVIGVAHPKWAERPLAILVTGEDQPEKPELDEFLKQKFAKWWVPDAYLFVDEIPKTSAGKFLKSALRDTYSDYYS